MKRNIADIRREYLGEPLSKKDVNEDPFFQFNKWFDEAFNADVDDPTAMTLATASSKGRVTARIVLLKGVEDRGFVFYTNYNSLKSNQIEENPYGSLVFFWPELFRQVRIEGKIELLSPRISEDYFNTRPEESKISARVSSQSSEIPNRKYLEDKIEQERKKFKGKQIPRPEYWGGYSLKPDRLEFWQGRENRLHDRIEFSLEEGKWIIRRLAP